MLRKAVLLAAALVLTTGGPALASGGAEPPRNIAYSFDGPFGQYDQAQLQRGFKVYREVCAGCHSLNLVSFRNLADKGGPFFDPHFANPNENPWAKAIAAEYQVADIDSETGDPIQRPATTADRFPPPYPNEAAARGGNGGAYPPDLSVLAKARAGGPAYIASLLAGYVNPPGGLEVPVGQYYNPYMAGDVSSAWHGDHDHVPPGGFIAMPPPLQDGLVTFDDGTPSTVEQQAKDVSAFLMWAAEPKLEDRKQMGFAVMVYLLLFAALLYVSYKRVWRYESH